MFTVQRAVQNNCLDSRDKGRSSCSHYVNKVIKIFLSLNHPKSCVIFEYGHT